MVRRPSLPARLPGEVVASLGVPSNEKVVAWGSSSDGLYVVATDRALYADGLGGRLAWSRISKAGWEEPILVVVALDESGRPMRPLRLRLDDSRELPPAVHDRVTSSVVISERVELGGGAKALLTARRDSDDGQIRWSVVFDAGLDPTDPALRSAADAALDQLRGSLGI
jgi:hypothetical protein